MNKLYTKSHIFVIISVLIIAIGMAVGTVCHFISNGFFNYGAEFSDYDSVSVSYYTAADLNDKKIDDICMQAFGDLKPVEISYASDAQGNSVRRATYKFVSGSDENALAAAVKAINAELEKDSGLSAASYSKAVTQVGGSKVVVFTSIAIASAVAFEALYILARYRKFGVTLVALLSQIVNFGLFAALLALTRIPVGIEAVAFSAIVVILTAITSCIFFDKVKANVKNEVNADVALSELIGSSASSTYKVNALLCAVVAVAVVIFAIFGLAASFSVALLLSYVAALIAVLVCWFGFSIFTPSMYVALSKLDEKKA